MQLISNLKTLASKQNLTENINLMVSVICLFMNIIVAAEKIMQVKGSLKIMKLTNLDSAYLNLITKLST